MKVVLKKKELKKLYKNKPLLPNEGTVAIKGGLEFVPITDSCFICDSF
ncbi:hypothetical protein [Pseudoalteromonas phenolica]|nr:hypothetical protein [Pseudoalteromonas phenolica]